MIEEHRFRAICRKDQGGIEGERFQKALDASKDDPVPVIFEVGIDEIRKIEISRQECEFYAKIAKEERQPEEELLKHIKPEAHAFVKWNRSKVISILQNALLEHKPSVETGWGKIANNAKITICWPLWTPDSIPVYVAEAYVRKYS